MSDKARAPYPGLSDTNGITIRGPTPRSALMLTLFYGPGACSIAAHIVLEESGEKYEPKRMDLAKGEQRSADYMKIHPLGRVPVFRLVYGSPLTENTAILPYLGKRFGMWPKDPLKEAKALAFIG